MSKVGRTGRLVGAGAAGLLLVSFVGGAALAAADGIGYIDGLSLAFSTVSTTGFGPGPQTTLGLAITMMAFIAGAACWFAILVAAFEIGLRRSGTSVGANGNRSIGDELWARAQLRRPGGHG